MSKCLCHGHIDYTTVRIIQDSPFGGCLVGIQKGRINAIRIGNHKLIVNRGGHSHTGWFGREWWSWGCLIRCWLGRGLLWRQCDGSKRKGWIQKEFEFRVNESTGIAEPLSLLLCWVGPGPGTVNPEFILTVG